MQAHSCAPTPTPNQQTNTICMPPLTYSAYVPQAQGRTPHTHSLSATQTALLAPLSLSLCTPPLTHSLCAVALCAPPHSTHSLTQIHSLHAGCLRPHSLTLTLHCGHVCAPARTHSGQPNPHSEQAVRAPTLHNYYGGYNCTPLPSYQPRVTGRIHT